jgi:hypothetical protein
MSRRATLSDAARDRRRRERVEIVTTAGRMVAGAAARSAMTGIGFPTVMVCCGSAPESGSFCAGVMVRRAGTALAVRAFAEADRVEVVATVRGEECECTEVRCLADTRD